MIAAYGVPFLNGMKYHFEMIACGGYIFFDDTRMLFWNDAASNGWGNQ